eukprot:scaffold126010_cov30-Phaeocystis_antarctica.AAC.1
MARLLARVAPTHNSLPYPPCRRFRPTLRGHNSGPFCFHDLKFGLYPECVCPLYAPCLTLLCNSYGKAPCYPLTTVYCRVLLFE